MDFIIEKFLSKEFYSGALKLCLISATAWTACLALTVQIGYEADLNAHDLKYQVQYLYKEELKNIKCELSDIHYVSCMNAKRAEEVLDSATKLSQECMKLFSFSFLISFFSWLISYFATSSKKSHTEDKTNNKKWKQTLSKQIHTPPEH